MNQEIIRNIIKNEVASGRIFSISWTKTSGERTTRTFTDKTYIPTGAGNNKKPYQIALTETIKVGDGKDKNKWSTIDLRTVNRIKARGKVYTF